MRAVLADRATESEAALALTMRLANAFEQDADDPAARAWKRNALPATTFRGCKRAVELRGETIENFGGNGYVEAGPMARLFPGSAGAFDPGKVGQCHVPGHAARAVLREPAPLFGLLDEMANEVGSADALWMRQTTALRGLLDGPPGQLEAPGRRFTQAWPRRLPPMLSSQRGWTSCQRGGSSARSVSRGST